MRTLFHLSQQVFDSPLMIVPEKLEALLAAFGPRFGLSNPALEELLSSRVLRRTYTITDATDSNGNRIDKLIQPRHHADLSDFDAFDYADDDPEDSNSSRKPYRITSTGIAIIPISGVLMKRGGWMAALSGCSGYDTIARAFDCALADDSVRGILFDVDSPGGTTHGCFELSDHIYSSRSDKPIRAACNDLAASAAYALASSASHLYLTRTGAVGSVGVFALHCDQSASDEQAGVKFTYVYAGDKKVDGNPHEPLSRSAKRDIQGEVDREYGIFVETVARNRDKGQQAIRDTEAGVEYADEAIPLLADQVCSLDDAVDDFSAYLDKRGNGRRTLAAASTSASSAASNSTGVVQSTLKEPKPMAKSEDSKKSKKAEAEDADAAEATSAADANDADAEASSAEDADDADDAEAKGPSDNDEDDEDEPEPPKKTDGKKAGGKKAGVTQMPVAASASNSSATEIAELCIIGGCPAKAATYITKGYSVDKVRAILRDKRAKENSGNQVSNSFGTALSGGSLVNITQQAKQMVAQSGGTMSLPKAMEQVIMNNPGLYVAYQDERQHAMETRQGAAGLVQQLEQLLPGMRLSTTR